MLQIFSSSLKILELISQQVSKLSHSDLLHPTDYPKDMKSLHILHARSTSTSFGEHKQSNKCVCKMPVAEGQALFRLRSTASKRSNTLLAQLCSFALSGSLCVPSHRQREARIGKRHPPRKQRKRQQGLVSSPAQTAVSSQECSLLLYKKKKRERKSAPQITDSLSHHPSIPLALTL